MKLLLTSAGIKNPSIERALVDLLGKPIAESTALTIPTSSYGMPLIGPERAWVFISGQEPRTPMVELGWKSIGNLELTALPSLHRDAWVPLVEETDVLLVNGGDPMFLAYWMQQSGLAELLPSLRNTVYVGLSAGSCVMAPHIGDDFVRWKSPTGGDETLGLVDFAIFPHLDHPDLPQNTMADAEKWAAGMRVPGYAIDDETAIKVTDGVAEVISEGHWKLFPRRFVKLLLTSAGVKNPSIQNALVDLLGKPIADSDALCIPTASYAHPMVNPQGTWRFISGNSPLPMIDLGWKSVGVLELTALPSIDKERWIPWVQETDVLLVGGGDVLYLCHWMRQSGLADLLPSFSDKVWVGLSAGSMVMTPRVGDDFIQWQPPDGDKSTLGVVDFSICPHLAKEGMPGNSMADAEQWAADIGVPAYAIDDETAIKVTYGVAEVISEGHWRLFNS